MASGRRGLGVIYGVQTNSLALSMATESTSKQVRADIIKD